MHDLFAQTPTVEAEDLIIAPSTITVDLEEDSSLKVNSFITIERQSDALLALLCATGHNLRVIWGTIRSLFFSLFWHTS